MSILIRLFLHLTELIIENLEHTIIEMCSYTWFKMDGVMLISYSFSNCLDGLVCLGLDSIIHSVCFWV